MADPARIAFIRQEFRRVRSVTSAAQTRHGALARETEDPVPTWFDNVADAQAIADERQALLSVERRLFQVSIKGTDEMMGLDPAAGTPVGRFIDIERGLNQKVLLGQIDIDLAAGKSGALIWG